MSERYACCLNRVMSHSWADAKFTLRADSN
jgi:hypothetical protein